MEDNTREETPPPAPHILEAVDVVRFFLRRLRDHRPPRPGAEDDRDALVRNLQEQAGDRRHVRHEPGASVTALPLGVPFSCDRREARRLHIAAPALHGGR